MTTKIAHRWVAIFLFVVCLLAGHALSQRKVLWNDEIHSQIGQVDRLSYRDIIEIRIGESLVSPLFYLMQKGICDLFGYRLYDSSWEWDGKTVIMNAKAQMILRISPNIFMSLSISLIFYFFTRFYSPWAGGYALLVTLSSFMVWIYWVEARPYAFWFFLTTAQSILFLILIKQKTGQDHLWNWLIGIHVLLSLTIITSLTQIAVVSFLLWLFKERRLKKYFFLTLIPVCICFFYFSHSAITWYRVLDPFELIFENISREKMFVFGMYAAFLISRHLKKEKGGLIPETSSFINGPMYFALTFLMVAGAAVMLAIMMMRVLPENATGLNSRLFLYLTPVGIIMTTLFSIDLFKAFNKSRWMRLNVILGLGGLLLIGILRTFVDVYALGLY